MEKTHWKSLRNNDYLGSWAFQPGQVMTATIKAVKKELVTGADGKKEHCTIIYFTEPTMKPFILNKTNGKVIEKVIGSAYTEDWAGRRIAMSVRRVNAFGDMVDAVRVEKYVPSESPKSSESGVAKCDECGNEITAAGKLNAAQVEAHTRNRYGRSLCADCATKIAAAQAEKEDSTNEPNPSGNAAERPENTPDSDA